MVGHSKWANIKRKKEANDKVKGKEFAKLSRIITLAVVEGNGIGDPEYNVRLRLAIDKAKQANMPKDNIQRAIEKGSGPDRAQIREVRYDAFGPSGSALLILASTDNPNRTSSEVRNMLDRNGGKMGNVGSVGYMFEHCAVALLDREGNAEDAVFAFAEQHGAIDFYEDDEYVVFFPYAELGKIKEYSQGLVLKAVDAEYRATTTLPVDQQTAERVYALIEALEDLDDVHGVYTNIVPQ